MWGLLVVREFGCASFFFFFYLKTEKETSCLPHLRLYDHPGKWEATSEFKVGLAKEIPILPSLNRLWLLRRPSALKPEQCQEAAPEFGDSNYAPQPCSCNGLVAGYLALGATGNPGLTCPPQNPGRWTAPLKIQGVTGTVL